MPKVEKALYNNQTQYETAITGLGRLSSQNLNAG